MRAMTTDIELFRAALEYIATLTPIEEILRRSYVAQQLQEFKRSSGNLSAAVVPGPVRGALLEILR